MFVRFYPAAVAGPALQSLFRWQFSVQSYSWHGSGTLAPDQAVQIVGHIGLDQPCFGSHKTNCVDERIEFVLLVCKNPFDAGPDG